PLEQAANHRFEEFERGAVIVGVERGLVVELAKSRRVLGMGMPAKRPAHVAVHSEVVKEIIALEDAMMLDHPVELVVDEGLQDRRGDLGMIVGTKRVADIMQQGHDDVGLAFAATMGARCGLEAMLQPVDRKSPIVAVEPLQSSEDTS